MVKDDSLDDGLIVAEDGKSRCWWHGNLPDYLAYHDNEWGRPVTNDQRLFEKICLEGFQSGLSWLTILRKRENFRAAFAGFDIDAVAAFTQDDVERCVSDAGIVRHRGKVMSAIKNARRAQELKQEYGSLSSYFWRWVPNDSERPERFDAASVKPLAITPTSTALSKELKKRGWSFVGPTTVYAFMQAMGLVNDHLEGCCMRSQVEEERIEALKRIRQDGGATNSHG